ncbi:related to 5-formyltetrahydrofolate cyclo-ligase [Sporisorium reilianum SRZ2]|uniref:5-formyltetrahydrofolate cyclo-ligase n=1 Tax=Sporisorium reilianum (strain SRZ2) TaxID=999809 RepID=E7A2K6_SPORE|nr:related to 5-formyltetrahydrofolate cyclo-ligase [Sporisorium reilianum SRZ2]
MASTGAAAATAATALRTAKRQLRKSMAQTLASMRPDEIALQSQKVAEQVLSSQTYARARSISVYIHMDVGEVATDQICRSVLKDGKRLYVPLFASPTAPAVAKGPTVPAATVDAKTEFATDMIMLRLRDVVEYESMAANRWGIREPPLVYADGTIREEALDETTGGDGLDLILAPGVAFDQTGGRLGHGKGYYDRYLTRAEEWANRRGVPAPVTVALALREQLLPSSQRVPADERDRVLDGIISPDGTILPPSSSRWSP